MLCYTCAAVYRGPTIHRQLHIALRLLAIFSYLRQFDPSHSVERYHNFHVRILRGKLPGVSVSNLRFLTQLDQGYQQLFCNFGKVQVVKMFLRTFFFKLHMWQDALNIAVYLVLLHQYSQLNTLKALSTRRQQQLQVSTGDVYKVEIYLGIVWKDFAEYYPR